MGKTLRCSGRKMPPRIFSSESPSVHTTRAILGGGFRNRYGAATATVSNRYATVSETVASPLLRTLLGCRLEKAPNPGDGFDRTFLHQPMSRPLTNRFLNVRRH